MCGIAGIVDLDGTRDVDRDALLAMTRALAHRGPDGEDFFIEPGAGFGHRRLAIIDRAGGAQPFQTGSQNGVLTYNGEIYNFRELARTIPAHFRSRSDTEVLAEGLNAFGAPFIDQLRGMFAFGFWKRRERELLLARDRLGERPLYYAVTDDRFLIFASEIGALTASGLVACVLDPEAAADYFHYGFVPDPKTIWRGVQKLPPAHILTLRDGAIETRRYWRPKFKPNSLGFEEAADTLRALLDDAVSSQLVADAPLGAFLSGGVDSASIVAAMAAAKADILTCTIGFREASHDERTAARETAALLGANHIEEEIDLDPEGALNALAVAYGEPFADTSALPSYRVAQTARRSVTVALTGDGADEHFAGYRRHGFFLAEERARCLAPASVRAALFGPLSHAYPKLDWAPRLVRFKSTLTALAATSAQAYADAMAINFPARMQALLSEDYKKTLGRYDPRALIGHAFNEADTDDPIARALYADLNTWLPGRMLVKVDRASMAHGLETRAPMLDHRLVEFTAALPSAYKLSHGASKRVLKAAQAVRLPPEILSRPKRGFDAPVGLWMRRAGAGLISRLNSSSYWRECGLFDERSVENLVAIHQSGRADCGQELWSILMFDRFLAAQRAHHYRADLVSRRIN